MKKVTKARKKIKLLKEIINDYPLFDTKGFNYLTELLKKQEGLIIEHQRHEAKLKAISEAGKAIKECLDMLKSDIAICKAFGYKEQPYKKVEYYKNISHSKMKEFQELKDTF